jgi:chaperonin GroES
MVPTSDRVLIRPVGSQEEEEDKLIITPDAYRYEPETCGIVEATGHLCKGEVKVGDFVYFSPHAGQAVAFDGNEYIMMREQEILAVAEKE